MQRRAARNVLVVGVGSSPQQQDQTLHRAAAVQEQHNSISSSIQLWTHTAVPQDRRPSQDVLLGSDVQQASLHPSEGVVNVKLGVEEQLRH